MNALDERIAQRIIPDPASGCHLWTGYTDRNGYGTVRIGRKSRLIHRVVYELTVGPIPDRAVLHHRCHCRNCCNPAHLEPMPQSRNARELVPWNRRKTHCPAGHSYAEHGRAYRCHDGNTRRFCLTCARERSRQRTRDRRAGKLAAARFDYARYGADLAPLAQEDYR